MCSNRINIYHYKAKINYVYDLLVEKDYTEYKEH